MICTVTFNPAIDYLLYVPRLAAGSINRSQQEKIFWGGKGINVSLILRELGIGSTATGFVAGFTGSAIEQGIGGGGIRTDFVHLREGFSRINVKLRGDGGCETDVNARGPAVTGADVEALLEKLERLGAGDVLVLAGSIPHTLPADIYAQIIARLDGRGIRFVVDAAGELLLNVLPYRPFLIKPNAEELGGLFGVRVDTPEDAARYAGKLRERGAANVLVSMGGLGAVLADEQGGQTYLPAVRGMAVNTVGAGDSMVAGFIAGYVQRGDYGYALRLGTAAGGATAFCEGLATGDAIRALMDTL